MKRGKKMLLLIASLALMIGLFTVTASAGYTSCAESLNQLGLFKGGDKGYDLDRAPSRTEAAVMLVRFLGQEDTAVSGYANGTYNHPFKDNVPAWANPYIAYLYTNGLTKGTGANTFSPSASCNAQQYATFVLRALGYTDSDFTYDKALEFGAKTGILDDFSAGENNFLRGNMAAISYTALGADMKGTNSTLLDQLVADKAVSAAAAKPYQTLFDNYANFQKAALVNKDTSMDADFSFDINAKSGNIQLMKMAGKGNLKLDASSLANTTTLDLNKLFSALPACQLIMTSDYSLTAAEQTTALGVDLYLKDGIAYMSTDGLPDNNLKVKMDLNNLGDMISANADSIDLGNMSTLPSDASTYGLAMLKNIDVTNKADGSVVYTMTISNLTDCVKSIYSSMPEMLDLLNQTGLSYNDAVCTYTFNKNGKLSDMDMKLGFDMNGASMELPNDVKFDMSMNIHLDTSGKSIVFKYPSDLNTYVDFKDLPGSV